MFQIALASRLAEWDSSEMIGDLFVASVSSNTHLQPLTYIKLFTDNTSVVYNTNDKIHLSFLIGVLLSIRILQLL